MSIKAPKNKMIGNRDFKNSPSLRMKERAFYFPNEHVKVMASNPEEAKKKMEKIKKNNIIK